MIMIDTSAWIEYFQDGIQSVAQKVDTCLDQERVAIGDIVFCEVMQGLRFPRERRKVSELLLSLPKFDMVGFEMAQKSASNYQLLRSKGVTVRKTIDVLIGTFCAENGFKLIHNDSDFDLMARHIGLDVL